MLYCLGVKLGLSCWQRTDSWWWGKYW